MSECFVVAYKKHEHIQGFCTVGMNIYRVFAQLFSMQLIVHFWSVRTKEIHFQTCKFSDDKFAPQPW